MIRRFKQKSRHIIVSGILLRINAFTEFHRQVSDINNRLKSLCQDEKVAFTTAWDHFYKPNLYCPDGLHLNEVGFAILSWLLHAKVISYSKNFRRQGGVNATKVA